MSLRLITLLCLGALVAACGAPPTPPATPMPAEPAPVSPAPTAEPAPTRRVPTGPLRPATVSKSGGDAEGVVVLWPRIIPASTAETLAPLAARAQSRMSGLVAQALPGRTINQRPAPQRSCPQAGCQGVSLGMVLGNVGQGCVAVALIGPPGQSPRQIVPWAGDVTLKAPTSPWRGQPESMFKITEFVPCKDLVTAMAAGDAAVSAALTAAANAP